MRQRRVDQAGPRRRGTVRLSNSKPRSTVRPADRESHDAADLFSGWGVGTLSSEHPAFNPFAYHRGTVWPVENGSFVLAMARYGLHPEMWSLARALFEAATLFECDRLPEVFAGHSRDQSHPFPGIYDRADSPQAWSASAPFLALQALLGMPR